MARYLDAQTRERHTRADVSIERCAKLLENPAIRERTDGMAEEAADLLPLLYVPNQREGYYQVSGRMYQGYGIPYIITLPGEQAKINRPAKYALHPIQRDGLRGVLHAHGIETTRKQYQDILGWIIDSYDTNTGMRFEALEDNSTWGACVYSPTSELMLTELTKPGSSHHYSVETSPVVYMKSTLQEQDESGDVLFHEVVHVIQCLKRIIYLTRRQTSVIHRYELEAYKNQAIAQEETYGHTAEENLNNWAAMSIEAIRRRVNAGSRDPYRVSKALLEEVAKAGRVLN